MRGCRCKALDKRTGLPHAAQTKSHDGRHWGMFPGVRKARAFAQWSAAVACDFGIINWCVVYVQEYPSPRDFPFSRKWSRSDYLSSPSQRNAAPRRASSVLAVPSSEAVLVDVPSLPWTAAFGRVTTRAFDGLLVGFPLALPFPFTFHLPFQQRFGSPSASLCFLLTC